MDEFDILTHIPAPSKCIFYGGSNSGKTVTCLDLIKRRNEIFRPLIEHVFLVYGSDNCDQYASLLDDAMIQFSSCDPEEVFAMVRELPRHSQKLIFVDDFGDYFMDLKKSQRQFMVHARHSNSTLLCSLQALNDGKGTSVNNLIANSDILFVHDSPFIGKALKQLNKNLFPTTPDNYLESALSQLHKNSTNPYEPLVIRLNQKFAFEKGRVSNNVFRAKDWGDVVLFGPKSLNPYK